MQSKQTPCQKSHKTRVDPQKESEFNPHQQPAAVTLATLCLTRSRSVSAPMATRGLRPPMRCSQTTFSSSVVHWCRRQATNTGEHPISRMRWWPHTSGRTRPSVEMMTMMLPENLNRFFSGGRTLNDASALTGAASFRGNGERWLRRRVCSEPVLAMAIGAESEHNDGSKNQYSAKP